MGLLESALRRKRRLQFKVMNFPFMENSIAPAWCLRKVIACEFWLSVLLQILAHLTSLKTPHPCNFYS